MKKSQPTSQLSLELPVASANCRDDLIESPANHMAIAIVDAWPNWPSSLTILAGPIGSGKTHIASIWADKAEALNMQTHELGANIDAVIKRAEAGACVVLEDATPESLDEPSLFHLLNALVQGGGYCLITSRNWPLEWGVKLPDLASRLKAAQLVEIQEPDDALLKQVMMKLFSDRQLIVDEKIIDYCVIRMERSLQSAGQLVAMIDEMAMQNKSSISKKLAARALERLS